LDVLVLGGSLALTFLRALGHNVGKSEKTMEGYEPPSIFPVARLLLSKAYRRGVKVILPQDFVMADQQLNFSEFPDGGRLLSSHNPKAEIALPTGIISTGLNTPLTDMEDSLTSAPETPLSRANPSEYDYRGDSYDGSVSVNSGQDESIEGGSYLDEVNEGAEGLAVVDEAFERSLEGSDATGAIHASLMKGLTNYCNEWAHDAPLEGSNGVEYEGETTEVALGSKMPRQWVAYDLGPQTVNTIKAEISDARTVLWNGLLGVCESSAFQSATREILEALTTAHDREVEEATGVVDPSTEEKGEEGKDEEKEGAVEPAKEPVTTFFVGHSTTLWIKRFLREDEEEGLVPGQGFSHFSTDSRFAQLVLSGKPMVGIQALSRRRPMIEELALLEEIIKLKEKAAELDESDEEEEDISEDDNISEDED